MSDRTNPANSQVKSLSIRYALVSWQALAAKSGPPGNQNAFRHGLAGIAQRRAEAFSIPQNNQPETKFCLACWRRKGGAAQISIAN